MDSGGTTTKTYALDEQGNIILEYKSGIGSVAVKKEEALNTIYSSIEYIYKHLPNDTLLFIELGLSGVGAIPSIDGFKKEINNKYKVGVDVVSDAHIALRSICDNDGIIYFICKH